MSPQAISMAIGVTGFVVSVLTSIFIVGARWASLKNDVNHIKIQLAEIRGMFVLRIRDDTKKEG